MRRRRGLTTALTVGLPFWVLVAGCGGGGGSSDPTLPGAVPVTASGSAPGPGAWIGGPPDFSATAGGEPAAEAALAADAATVAAAAGTATVADEAPVTPGPGPGGPVDVSPLRAGNVDDNADFGRFLDYLARIRTLGIATRPFDATGRVVVRVTRPDGGPAAGVEVTVAPEGGSPIATVRTTADGTARFLPHLYGDPAARYELRAGGEAAIADSGGAATLVVDAPTWAAPVALDVLFLLDATGSMGDEIDRLKSTIDTVAERVGALDTDPDVRFAMTLYRDLDDSFVTSTYDFTGDIASFRGALGSVVADGGDDYPEALDEGFAEALAAPSWRDPATTVQLVFLVADAPPQVTRQVDVTYVQSIAAAVSRGIKVFPIASSESDDLAEAVFRQIAVATGARFVFLSGGAGGLATGDHTDIASTDYEELALDELVIRLVTEELAALTGTAPVAPPTPTTAPPTNPAGQQG